MRIPQLLVLLLLLITCLPYDAVNRPSGHPVTAQKQTVTANDILRELNLARQNPAQYAAVLEQLRPLYKGKYLAKPGQVMLVTKEGVKALEEAIRFLKKAEPLPALRLSKGMSLAALDHVHEQGWNGNTGHRGTDGSTPDKRLARYGTWLYTMGENISYGGDNARDVVIDLIVDDGVPDRGHRKNIFNPNFRVVGAAYGPHAQYGTICVMTFAGEFKEN
ncbi:CAP domain-containing protein [candidate division KSB1 bacterium]|nr:CAP domain-containing protein [candidate division KSB1 bacterium]